MSAIRHLSAFLFACTLVPACADEPFESEDMVERAGVETCQWLCTPCPPD